METTDLLKNSNLSNDINIQSLTVEKIEEYISTLKEFQNQSESDAKFVEAELAKQKIAQLNKVKAKKNLLEAIERHQQERKMLEKKQKDELDKFNTENDKKFYDLSENFKQMQTKLDQEHETKVKELQEKYENKFKGMIAKPSPELINLNRKLEVYIQKKDYPNAHQVQNDIASLTKKEEENYNKEKYRMIQKEIENFQKKQNNESKRLEQKIQSYYNKYKKDRALKVQELLLKYKNQLRDLETRQENEKKDLENVINGGLLKKGRKVEYGQQLRGGFKNLAA